jgi:peptidoglycan/LPS O-acetylase OafA/YrhL
MSEKKYFYSLDLFRGFCGYGVAFCHLHAFIFKNINMEYLSLLFVEFFFVLSGFVLYPQLIKIFDNKKNLFIFYKRRWIRTLPLYVIALVVVSALTSELLSKDFFKYLFFIQKTIPNFITNDYYPVAWSLSIEEMFYLFFPILFIIFNKKNIIKNISIIFLLILSAKYFFAESIDANFFRTGTFLRLDAILLGFLLRHFYTNICNFKFSILAIFIIMLSIFYFSHNNMILLQEKKEIKYLFILNLQLLSVLSLLLFTFMEPLISKSKKLTNISLLISRQTYSIYLIHMIFIYLLEKIQLSFFLTNIIYIFLLFIFSLLIFNYIEKPLLGLRPKMR